MRCTEAFASATVFVVTDFFCFSFFSFNSFASLSLSSAVHRSPSLSGQLGSAQWSCDRKDGWLDWLWFDSSWVELRVFYLCNSLGLYFLVLYFFFWFLFGSKNFCVSVWRQRLDKMSLWLFYSLTDNIRFPSFFCSALCCFLLHCIWTLLLLPFHTLITRDHQCASFMLICSQFVGRQQQQKQQQHTPSFRAEALTVKWVLHSEVYGTSDCASSFAYLFFLSDAFFMCSLSFFLSFFLALPRSLLLTTWREW